MSCIKYIFTIFLLLNTASLSAAPFQNGSFEEDDGLYDSTFDVLGDSEQDLTGWVITDVVGSHTVDWCLTLNCGGTSGALAAHDGNYYLELVNAPNERAELVNHLILC